jgi:hypothetical protein
MPYPYMAGSCAKVLEARIPQPAMAAARDVCCWGVPCWVYCTAKHTMRTAPASRGQPMFSVLGRGFSTSLAVVLVAPASAVT